MITKQSVFWVVVAWGLSSWFLSASVNQDPNHILAKYESTFKQIKEPDDVAALTGKIGNEFGLTVTLMSFINTLSEGGYTKQLEALMDVPVQQWNPNAGPGGWGRYEIKNAQRIVNKYQSVQVYNKVSSVMDTTGKCLTAISILQDCIAAYEGNDQAKLSAIGKMAKWVQGDLVNQLGSKNLSIAMAGVAIVDYALSEFINFAFTSHQEYWWQGYVAYMEAKYPSPLEWAQLAEREGMDAVNRRLQEFWDNAEMNASIYALDGKRPPPSWGNVAGDLLAKFKREFAATYYKDYIHTTLTTYYRLKAEQAKAELELNYARMALDLETLSKDMQNLKAALENLPADEPADQNIGALVDRLEVIAGQVTAKSGEIKADSESAKGRLDACMSTLTDAAGKLQALSPEVLTWEADYRQASSIDVDVDAIRASMKTQSEQVMKSRDTAEEQALKACQEAVALNQATSEAEKRLRRSKIKATANMAMVAGQRARTTWRAMVIQLETLRGRDDTMSKLERARQSMLARIPELSSCQSGVEDARAVLAELEAEMQVLQGMEQTADGLVTQARTIVDGPPADDTQKLKRSLMRMKDKAAWMVHKNKLAEHQGTIKSHIQAGQSAVAALRASLEAVETKLSEVEPIHAEITDKLSQSALATGDDSPYLELKSWVDTAELFVEPAEIAAEQARLCRDEAEGRPVTPDTTQISDRDQDGQTQDSGTQSAGATGTTDGTATTGSAESSAWVSTGAAEVIHEEPTTPSGTSRGSEGARSGTTPARDPRVEGWIRQAEAHFDQCQFAQAQNLAGSVARFAPNHPWLTTNGPVIDRNARKQQQALNILAGVQEQLAGGNLTVGQLKSIRDTVDSAARRAPDCMVDGIRGIYDRISAGIADARARDRAATQQAMGDFLDAFTSAAAATHTANTGRTTSTSTGSTSTTRTQTGDPCEHKYTYRNKWNPEPVCDCPGYSWDGKKHKCVYTGETSTTATTGTTTGSTSDLRGPRSGEGPCEIIYTTSYGTITHHAVLFHYTPNSSGVKRHYFVVGLGPQIDPLDIVRRRFPNCSHADVSVLATGTQAQMNRQANQLCPEIDVPLQ